MHVDTFNLTTNLISLSFNLDNQCWNSLFSIDQKWKKPTCTEKQPLDYKCKDRTVWSTVVGRVQEREQTGYNPLTLSNTQT